MCFFRAVGSLLLAAMPFLVHAMPPQKDPSDAGRAGKLIFLEQDEEMRLALGAAPEHLRAQATVYVFQRQGYAMIKQGTNNVVCLVNRDGQQTGSDILRPTCWDAEGSATIVPVMLRVGELLALGKPALEIKHDIDAGFSDGRFSSPRKTGIAYMLLGDIRYDSATKTVATLFHPHYMIYAAGVTNSDIGLTKAAQEQHRALPFIFAGYSGGAHTAYLIIPASPGHTTP
jgi:hypothetical protein